MSGTVTTPAVPAPSGPFHVLVLGASGFIGSHLVAALLAAGHRVSGAVRDPDRLGRRFPGVRPLRADLLRLGTSEAWMPLLTGVDAVVGCAGLLQPRREADAWAVHRDALAALALACERVGVRKVVQVGAISATSEAGTTYALSRLAGETALRRSSLDWTLVRPSLVYASDPCGGTSAMRGLAGLPFVIPVPGAGNGLFQPIHADDVASVVLLALDDPRLSRAVVDATGPETLSLGAILLRLRDWLGLPPVPLLRVPAPLVRLLARVGDLMGTGPLNSTSLRQSEHGNVGDPQALSRLGIRARTMAEWAQTEPSGEADRLHARLWLLPHLAHAALLLCWAASGVLGLLWPPREAAALAALVDVRLTSAVVVASCGLDLLLACLLLLKPRWRPLGLLQVATVVLFTAALTAVNPSLWADPYGPLLKNIPFLILVLAWSAARESR